VLLPYRGWCLCRALACHLWSKTWPSTFDSPERAAFVLAVGVSPRIVAHSRFRAAERRHSYAPASALYNPAEEGYRMKNAMCFSVVLLAAVGSYAADTQTALLTGKLLSEDGRPVVGAHVELLPRHVIKPQGNVLLKSSAAGEFSAKLAPGVYDIFISDTCFAPLAKEVSLFESKHKTLKLALNYSRVLICDRFEKPEPPSPFVPLPLPGKIAP